MSETLHLICASCGRENRIPAQRLGDRPVCGRCRAPLFPEKPFALDGASLERHATTDGVPLLVDFWAAWCDPCRQMAPQFEAAASLLAPRVRLAKLDTEAAPEVSARLGIRGIPTMILFAGGREVARESGAMDAKSVARWAHQRLD